MRNLISNFFHLKESKTSFTTEILAGLTTFCTMAYIIVVNPAILHASGMNQQAVFVATCLIAIFGTLFTGLVANYPIAVAPSMGVNVYFSYILVKHLGFSWQASLGFILIAGLLFMFCTVSKVRQKIIHALPDSLNIGMTAGLGLLIILVALENNGILVATKNHFFALGDFKYSAIYLPIAGLALIAFLNRLRVPGSIFITIIAITVFEIATGSIKLAGFFSMPPSLLPTLGKLHVDIRFNHLNLGIILSLFVVIFFDSTGTLIGLLKSNRILSTPAKKKNLYKALFADSLSTIFGTILGTSSSSPYVESATGIRSGGRTGLTAVTVALLFFLSLFFSPLVKIIPSDATTPALLFVGILMVTHVKHLDWHKFSEFFPAILGAITIGATLSIANGVGIGFLCYILLQLLTKKKKVLTPINIILTILFVLYFIGTFHQYFK